MSIYTKDELKTRKHMRELQIIDGVFFIAVMIWTLIAPTSSLVLMAFISLFSEAVSQMYLDRITIWDLKEAK